LDFPEGVAGESGDADAPEVAHVHFLGLPNGGPVACDPGLMGLQGQ